MLSTQARCFQRTLLAAICLLLGGPVVAEAPAAGEAQPERNPELWPQLTSGIARDAEMEARIDALLARMSVEQKAGQMLLAEIQGVNEREVRRYHLGGVFSSGGSYPNLNKNAKVSEWVAMADAFYEASMDSAGDRPAIPIMWGTDAVHGHNNVVGATIFPHNIGLGATQNPDLIELVGKVTAREVAATGIDWVFGPSIAVARNDRWGRVYESFSEDPLIVYNYAGRYVAGLQGDPAGDDVLGPANVIATAKHWIGDGGTHEGRDQGENWATEQALMVLHGQGYFSAIEAGLQTIMASFNSWQGQKLHGHRYLLTDVLKNRMGFDGLVVSDWNGHFGAPDAGRPGVPGCTLTRCDQAVIAGIDLLMVPYDWKEFHRNLVRSAASGAIPMERIDDAVRRVLRVKMRAGLFEAGKPSERPLAGRDDLLGAPQHRAIARQAVRESLVLLKNERSVLPLAPGKKILVAGSGADNIPMQCGGWTVSWQGNDTSNADFPGATSILAGIRSAVEAGGGSVTHSPDGSAAGAYDAAVVVFGEPPYAEFEGDRKDLNYSIGFGEGLAILQGLQARDIPTVAVFLTGRPLWVTPELEASDAFVVAWLPGTEGGGIADVLFSNADGAVEHDFYGRLGFSWPKTPDQQMLNRHDPEYDPLFPYGFGLDYSGADASVQ